MGAEPRGSGAAGMSTQGENPACLKSVTRRPEGPDEGGEENAEEGRAARGPVPELGPPFWGLQEATGGVKPQAQFPELPGKPMVGA